MSAKNWVKLSSDAEFKQYQDQVLQEYSLQAARVIWGNVPKAYPCLAASVVTNGAQAKVVTAYVYRSDAENLLSGDPPARPSKTIAQALDETRAAPDTIGRPSQAQFNRWMSALTATVVHFLLETGICKEAQFEDALLTKLELVDKFTDEQFEEYRKKHGAAQATLIQKLSRKSKPAE